MNLPNYPDPKVKEFGERVSSALMEAQCQVAMGGLGGCKTYDLSNFDADLRPYIAAYLDGGNHDSLAVIYAAMRTKELTCG